MYFYPSISEKGGTKINFARLKIPLFPTQDCSVPQEYPQHIPLHFLQEMNYRAFISNIIFILDFKCQLI